MLNKKVSFAFRAQFSIFIFSGGGGFFFIYIFQFVHIHIPCINLCKKYTVIKCDVMTAVSQLLFCHCRSGLSYLLCKKLLL